MAIVTLEQVKALLGIADNSKDAQISALIEPVEEHYLRIRNKPFETDEEGKTVYPEGAALTVAKMIQFHLNTDKRTGIAGQSLGDHSVTFKDTIQGYPREIVGGIRRFVKFV